MMGKRNFATRRELEEHHFSAFVLLTVPALALFLYAYLPKLWPAAAICDLPLIVVIFFALSQRSPIVGTLSGATIGLLQDTLTNQYIGVNGIAKCIVGFLAASVGLKIDVENAVSRAMLIFGFSLMHSALLFLVQRLLLGAHDYDVRWLHELIRACVNTAVAVPVFYLLDFTRSDD